MPIIPNLSAALLHHDYRRLFIQETDSAGQQSKNAFVFDYCEFEQQHFYITRTHLQLPVHFLLLQDENYYD